MAWRDSRRNRSRLLLFISSIILGIAALVAIYSLGDNLNSNIDQQAATLLGADLALTGNQESKGDTRTLLDSISALALQSSEERSFASMVYFVNSDDSRLAQVKALSGTYPYYGSLETMPVAAGQTFRNHQQALVDHTLMLQYGAEVGDSIKIGDVTFVIAGALEKAPGQNGLTSTVAPAVYIPMQYLQQTGLMQKGSRIAYRYYFQMPEKINSDLMVASLEKRLELADLDYKTIQTQKEDTGRSFRDLTRFLGLIGFVALLLGCIGVASAIHIYIKEKLRSIAILRCLGVKPREAFLIYLIQILLIGILGSMAGALLGTIIQQFLPLIIIDILPFELETSLSWLSISQGIIVGSIISLLFALPPLLSIRSISPLNVLRQVDKADSGFRDPLLWIVYLLILIFVYGFSFYQMKNWITALTFTVSVAGSFLFLYGIAISLMWAVRRYFPSSWGYLPRQGLANLFRPNNQTAILIVSIGLATSLMATLFLVQNILMARVQLSTRPDQPNIVLFDIQTEQKEGILSLAAKNNIPVNQSVPIVNMRLEEINGKDASHYQADTIHRRVGRLFGREYRVTFRDSLTSSESILDGEWKGKYDPTSDLVPISVEKGFADRGKMALGDTLTFNVQGTLMQTRITSLRDVNWAEVQTNFLVLFPTGVLEDAPQFHVVLTHVPNAEMSARFQQEIVEAYPNVSVIDLALIIKVLDEIFTKIGFVIRFMAGFSILTGIIVLIASVLISKYQRLQESVLLRTLGASRKQILTITALEYVFLGGLASLTGIVISTLASWALARFSFDAPFTLPIWPLLGIALLVTVLTVVIGLANSRGILSRSPLEVLRRDA